MSDNMHMLKNKSILYAEDDISSRTQMTTLLEMLFCKVVTAVDGEDAWRLYQDERFDIVLTDIKMPRKDGLKLVQHIRGANYATPVVLLTSFMDQQFLFKAANLSVDGYIIKPIDLETLIETLGRALERTKAEDSPILLDEGLSYNPVSQELYYDDGTSITLSAMELKLLNLFVLNRNMLITKEMISEELWPLEPICDSAIKTMVLRLRRKIGAHLIVSIYGVGYRMRLKTKKTSL
jgi:DNA-binding response OmpR family regulator